MIKKIIFFLLLAVAIGYALIRFTDSPTAMGVLGLLAATLIFLYCIMTWFSRKRHQRDGPPLRPYFYIGLAALLATIFGHLVFDEISKTPKLPTPGATHTARINTVITSPNADKLASAGVDRKIQLWTVAQDKLAPEREFPEDKKSPYETYAANFTCVARQPEGDLIAFGDDAGVIRLWDTKKNIVQQLREHRGAIRALVFSPNGTMLFSGSDDKTVRSWRVADGVSKVLEGGWKYSEPITALAISPDGNLLVVGSADKSVTFWDVINNNLLNADKTSTEAIIEIAFTKDGQYVLGVSEKRMVKRWRVSDRTTSQKLYDARAESITSAAFSRDGRFLATGERDKIVRIWTLDFPAPAQPPRAGSSPTPLPNNPARECKDPDPKDFITSIAFDNEGAKLAAATKGNVIQVFGVPKDGKECPFSNSLTGHTDTINKIVIDPKGALWSASADKSIRSWSLADAKGAGSFDSATDEIIRLAFGPKQASIVSLTRDGVIRSWQTSDRALQYELNWKQYETTSLAVSPTANDVLAIGTEKGLMRLGKYSDPTPREIPAHSGAISSMAYSLDGKILATGGKDKVIHFWQSADGQALGNSTYKGHLGDVTTLVFSPDSKTLASASLEDQTVRLWRFTDTQTMTQTKPSLLLSQTTNGVTALAFSGDGKTLVTGGYDNEIRVWNVEDGALITTLPAYIQPVAALGIALDDSIIATGVLSNGISIQMWVAGNLKQIRDPYSEYWWRQRLIGTETARTFWASVLGSLAGVVSILVVVALYSAVASRASFSSFSGFSAWDAWLATIGIELGLHKIQQVVAGGEVKTVRPAVGPLARIGGPGVLIVEEGHAAVLMASGRITRVVGNGIKWLKQFERVQMVVPLPVRVETVVVKDVVTLDQMVLDSFELLVFHRADRGDGSGKSGQYSFDSKVILEKIWSPKGSDWREVVKSMSETTIRDVIAQFRFENIASVSGVERSDLIRALTTEINRQTQGFLGVEVIGCNIGAIGMSKEAKAALQKKGLAEVERQTQVISAEGDKEAAVRRGEGKAIEIRQIQKEKNAARRELLQQLIEAFRLMTEKIRDAPEFTRNYPDFVKSYMQAIEQLVERIESLDKISNAEGPKTFIVGDTQGFAQSTDATGTPGQRTGGVLGPNPTR